MPPGQKGPRGDETSLKIEFRPAVLTRLTDTVTNFLVQSTSVYMYKGEGGNLNYNIKYHKRKTLE